MTIMPKYTKFILSKLSEAGFAAYAVGGCVRDTLMGRKPHDWDVTTAAKAEDTMRLFRKTVPTGVKYGTVTVLVHGGRCEVTTFRSDGEYLDSRRPESVTFVPELRLDLERRDFTMNAMAMSAEGEITDLFGGREDIERRLIRCVGDPDKRFNEDALRMLRAVRFSAQLGFEIEANTLSSIRRNAPSAQNLSEERVATELQKILLSPRPEKAEELCELGLLSAFHVGGAELTGLRRLPRDVGTRWVAYAALVRYADGDALLRELKLPAAVIKAYLPARRAYEDFQKMEVRRLIAVHGEQAARNGAAIAEAFGEKHTQNRVKTELKHGGFVSETGLKIDGNQLRELGFSGEEIGKAKKKLSVMVSLGEVKNDAEELKKAAVLFDINPA